MFAAGITGGLNYCARSHSLAIAQASIERAQPWSARSTYPWKTTAGTGILTGLATR